ncbi:elongation factor P 5-aminopentanone reductase [Brevibacillus sp. B_LB10_24]|uniref:elongation factor P 5-aminopentanone reductase n=1 Tax=Brevibacillus sp. B_LB10_24 TaxID=3380645 RepID=UPI0038BC763D
MWGLVTGASGELGQAVSIALVKRGIPLYLHYHLAGDKLQGVLQLATELGVPAYPLQADLRDPGQVHRMFGQMPVKPLLLVNNAAVDHVGLIHDVTPEQFDNLVHTNVRAPFFVTQAALPAMIQAKYGRIVNLSSIWGLTGSACEVLYSTTKGAVLAFTKALAKELAPSSISVNAIAPGAIEGGMMNRFSPEDVQEIVEAIPAGRLGRPEEVASLAVYLLSPEAGYITGQVISPNGGWYT